MPFVFRNRDLQTLETRLNLQKRVMIDQSTEIMEITMREAEDLQRELLDAATTRTGEKRYAAGRGASAGRRDTDEMYEGIGSEVEATSKRVVGRWGWLNDPKAYYSYQDYGTGRIPPAGSLIDSFIQIRERFIKRVVRLARGGRAA